MIQIIQIYPLILVKEKKLICDFDQNVINNILNKRTNFNNTDLNNYTIDTEWNKTAIVNRTDSLTKIAIDFFIYNKMNTDILFN